MKAIHTILRAIRTFAGATGNPKLALEASAADVGLTAVETVAPLAVSAVDQALAKLIAQAKMHAADGTSTVFVSMPETASLTSKQYRHYVETVRDAFDRERAVMGTALPRVVMLAPGLTMEVVKGTAKEFESAIQYLESLPKGMFNLK